MADYRDLLRRAIDALPENNGIARRQVYDKARMALRKQLNAIAPPLPGREKTYHRLQLEECIREVEQEATERILSGLSHLEEEAFGTHSDGRGSKRDQKEEAAKPPDARGGSPDADEAGPRAKVPEAKRDTSFAPAQPAPTKPEPTPSPKAGTKPAPAEAHPQKSTHANAPAPMPAETRATQHKPAPTAEAVISRDKPAPPRMTHQPTPLELAVSSVGTASHIEPIKVVPRPVHQNGAPLPLKAEVPAAFAAEKAAPERQSAKETFAKDAAEAAIADAMAGSTPTPPPKVAPDSSDRAQREEAAKKHPIFARFSSKVAGFTSGSGAARPEAPTIETPAMSAEREVELDADAQTGTDDTDPQVVIDHAIAVLDREAKGGGGTNEPVIGSTDPDIADIDFARAEAEDEGGGSPALTIFLVLVLLLLAGAGGASYWAWREGYLDLSNLFGTAQTTTSVSEATTPTDAPIVTVPLSTGAASAGDTETVETSRPGNTVATPDVVETPATGLEQSAGTDAGSVADASALVAADSAAAQPTMDAGAANDAAAAAAGAVTEPSATDDKNEQRLPIAAATQTDTSGQTNVASVSPDEVTAGSQSLLLEVSDTAGAGAVPFSGTVEWTRGVDELGQPTLNATVNIPARNMSVTLLIRKNTDPTLPASHLMEIDFTVSDSFIGGGIARIAGILMKNEELVQGVPLIGASARVVGNSFLFALSAADKDVAANDNLLQSRKWMDLAIIYSTGKQALLTFEKDDTATKLFDEVMAAWGSSASATSTG